MTDKAMIVPRDILCAPHDIDPLTRPAIGVELHHNPTKTEPADRLHQVLFRIVGRIAKRFTGVRLVGFL
jgi:hypothetical protein